MKVLVTEKIAETGLDILRKEYTVEEILNPSPEELLNIIPEYDALIVRSATQATAEVIKAGANLKIIGRAGIGVDNIDTEAATRKGVVVANAPQSNIVSAAEHAIALLLALCRKIPGAHTELMNGKWARSKYEGVELYGKTVGVLGLGKIGTLVVQRLQGFDVKIIGYDPYISPAKAKELGVDLATSLDDLLKEADFISVHLPKNKETIGLLGKKELESMKPTARIVNAARGGIIDEEALAGALKSGVIAGAALDVFVTEPCTDSPLFELDNIVVTPHLGASTEEAQDKAGIAIAEQVAAGLRGDFVSTAVNIQVTGMPDAIKPFLPLAERLGKLFTYITESGPLSALEIEYAGQLSEVDTSLLTVAALRGIFSGVIDEPVTYVNAPLLAKERGITVRETRTTESPDYVNVITLRGSDASKQYSVGGTLLGKRNQERFVSIYDFDIDMIPSRFMAFFRYEDRPGMIGRIGTIVGEKGINIAKMEVGRKVIGGEALMGLNVDGQIPQEVLDEVLSIKGVAEAKFLEF